MRDFLREHVRRLANDCRNTTPLPVYAVGVPPDSQFHFHDDLLTSSRLTFGEERANSEAFPKLIKQLEVAAEMDAKEKAKGALSAFERTLKKPVFTVEFLKPLLYKAGARFASNISKQACVDLCLHHFESPLEFRAAIEELGLTRANAKQELIKLQREDEEAAKGGAEQRVRVRLESDSDSESEAMEEDREDDEEEEGGDEEKAAAPSRSGRKRTMTKKLSQDAPSKEESKRQRQQEREEDALAAATKIIIERQTTAKKKGWSLCKVCALDNKPRCDC